MTLPSPHIVLRVVVALAIVVTMGALAGCGVADDVANPGVQQPLDEDPSADPPTEDPQDPPPPCSTTVCGGTPRIPGTGLGTVNYNVQLTGSTVQVSGGSAGGSYSVSQNSGTNNGVKVLYLDGDVSVRGNLNGRLTIAARNRQPGRAADIRIVGNVRTLSTDSAIGLVAQGNVIVEARGCGTNTVDAAILAETGGLTIEPDYLTPVPLMPGGGANRRDCGQLTINGAIAGHKAPTLYWTWPGRTHAGFSARRYNWDARLMRNPPPYFPNTEDWKVTSWRKADATCITMNAESCA